MPPNPPDRKHPKTPRMLPQDVRARDVRPGFYDRGYRPLEAQDLQDALKSGLADEIAMLRVSLRRLFELTGEELESQEARQALNALGLAATRLAHLLKVEYEISGQSESSSAAIRSALDQTIEEMRAEGRFNL